MHQDTISPLGIRPLTHIQWATRPIYRIPVVYGKLEGFCIFLTFACTKKGVTRKSRPLAHHFMFKSFLILVVEISGVRGK